jgi:hypothetical protein
MLTGMSLITLARDAPAGPPFNANFYIVTATVIPVLYLAIAVQGRGVEDLIKLSIRASLRTVSDPRPRESGLRQQAANSLAGIPAVIALLILLAGAGAEVLAIVALYQQHASGGTGAYVLTGVLPHGDGDHATDDDDHPGPPAGEVQLRGGRPGPGVLHPAAHRPKSPCAGMTLYQVLRELQIVLALILGACPLCCQPLTLDRLAAALAGT